jgi:hypothetical protein
MANPKDEPVSEYDVYPSARYNDHSFGRYMVVCTRSQGEPDTQLATRRTYRGDRRGPERLRPAPFLARHT